MKEYKQPVVRSEQVLEKTALACNDYAYYTRVPTACCWELYMGMGKGDGVSCAGLMS